MSNKEQVVIDATLFVDADAAEAFNVAFVEWLDSMTDKGYNGGAWKQGKSEDYEARATMNPTQRDVMKLRPDAECEKLTPRWDMPHLPTIYRIVCGRDTLSRNMDSVEAAWEDALRKLLKA
jgi:hypothetical protein